MTSKLRPFVIFGAPLLVGTVNLVHPVITPPIYPQLAPHLHTWLHVHLLNMFLFPLLGVATLLLLTEIRNPAATVARIATAIYIPVYVAFDALAGIGTGLLVEKARNLGANELPAASRLIDGYWTSDLLMTIAILGSMAWTGPLGMLCFLLAAVSVESLTRKQPTAISASA